MNVALGTVKRSWLMNPLNSQGGHLNGGNYYANANDEDAAFDYAERVNTNGILGRAVYGVHIRAQDEELTSRGWSPIRGTWESVTVWNANMPRQSCYDTTAMDYFETVHPKGPDGKCQCGDPTRNAR
jgi:hypothetical protein